MIGCRCSSPVELAADVEGRRVCGAGLPPNGHADFGGDVRQPMAAAMAVLSRSGSGVKLIATHALDPHRRALAQACPNRIGNRLDLLLLRNAAEGGQPPVGELLAAGR